MKQILESMLNELEWLSKNASNWEYYLGKYDLCKELLSQLDHKEFSYDKNDRTTDVKARYSFILKKINGKVYIIKQHSSVAN